MPIQCPNCKALNRDTATFCDSCGSRLIVPSEQVTPAAAVQKPETIPEDQAGPTAAVRPAETRPQDRAVPTAASRPPGTVPSTPPFPDSTPVQTLEAPKIWGKSYTGIVTYLHSEVESESETETRWGLRGLGVMSSIGNKRKEKSVHYWAFNLQRTDKDWQPLKDRRGFLLPVLEVEFRSTKLHGPPLEEGSQVVLKGRREGDRVKAKEIWNLSPGAAMPVHGEPASFWGRVTALGSRSAPDLRFPGQHRYIEVWSFRLQRTGQDFQQLLRDAQGNLLPPLPVEIRAQVISGPLQENDKIEVHGQVVRGTLHTKEVHNHSAGGASLVVKEWAGIP